MARIEDLKFVHRVFMKAYRFRQVEWHPGARLSRPLSESKLALMWWTNVRMHSFAPANVIALSAPGEELGEQVPHPGFKKGRSEPRHDREIAQALDALSLSRIWMDDLGQVADFQAALDGENQFADALSRMAAYHRGS